MVIRFGGLYKIQAYIFEHTAIKRKIQKDKSYRQEQEI